MTGEGQEGKTVPSGLPGQLPALGHSVPLNSPERSQARPTSSARQQQRPPCVARAQMEKGTEETLKAAWAIQECFLEEVTARLGPELKDSY